MGPKRGTVAFYRRQKKGMADGAIELLGIGLVSASARFSAPLRYGNCLITDLPGSHHLVPTSIKVTIVSHEHYRTTVWVRSHHPIYPIL